MCLSSAALWRVSSAAIRSTLRSTSRARADKSSRLPIGVATTQSFPAGRSGIMDMDSTGSAMPALRLSRLLICCLACLWFCGCVEIGGVREEPGAALDAEQAYRQGDFDRAAQAFLQLADAHSGDRAHYRLRAAEAYHENGETDAVAQ